ncbi:hypothetical protein FLT15_07205 [Paenibacillus thiaminolyticus]|uniref:hypothetical protein n=1 Tax=Paenibacillus thiaminolyticus TaxID=49283 RepID=UPI0011634EFD|nr:hypothetical protein [Paenibacillus thiaminolyticus]NGP58186.1 hypothetical protein [Paenibacillus thiaminolyticus]
MIINVGEWRALTKGERESAIKLMAHTSAEWREKMVQRAIKEYMPVYQQYLNAKNPVEAAQFHARMRKIERKYGIPAVVAS